MPQIPGTIPLTGAIAPTDSLDSYPIADMAYIKGGLKTVATIGERNDITGPRREPGMLVFVQADSKYYQLSSDQVTWTELNFSGGTFLPLAGGTMTGALILWRNPVGSFEAATKTYVDQVVASAPYLNVDTGGVVKEPVSLTAVPVDDSHAVNKGWVLNQISALVSGMQWKTSAKGVITGVEPTSGTYTTADGVVLSIGDRVIRNSTTTPALNGIYVVAAGVWQRSTDADTASELRQATLFVEQGTSWADRMFIVATDNIVLGTTHITWVIINPGTIPVAGTGLSQTGNVFNVDYTQVQPRTYAMTAWPGPTSTVNLDNGYQNYSTPSGGTGTSVQVTGVVNPGIGKSVMLQLTSQHASDTFSVAIAGATVYTEGSPFVAGRLNIIVIQCINTNTYLVLRSFV